MNAEERMRDQAINVDNSDHLYVPVEVAVTEVILSRTDAVAATRAETEAKYAQLVAAALKVSRTGANVFHIPRLTAALAGLVGDPESNPT